MQRPKLRITLLAVVLIGTGGALVNSRAEATPQPRTVAIDSSPLSYGISPKDCATGKVASGIPTYADDGGVAISATILSTYLEHLTGIVPNIKASTIVNADALQVVRYLNADSTINSQIIVAKADNGKWQVLLDQICGR